MGGLIRNLLKTIASRIPLRRFEGILRYPIIAQRFSTIRTSTSFQRREDLWDDLFAEVTKVPVCVLEFGVWQGYSLNHFARLNRNPESVFYGFDSFEGLPEDWHTTRARGHFSTGGAIPEVDDPRVRFVKGWFNPSLPRFWIENQELVGSIHAGERELLVHFDADLFSSTLYVLASLAVAGFERYRFIFDDFMVDEARALHAATQAFGLEPEFRGFVAVNSLPMQVSGVMGREESGTLT